MCVELTFNGHSWYRKRRYRLDPEPDTDNKKIIFKMAHTHKTRVDTFSNYIIPSFAFYFVVVAVVAVAVDDRLNMQLAVDL